MRKTGHYKQIGSTEYFIPAPLPPKSPPFTMNSDLINLYGEAMTSLGKLNEMAHKIPDKQQFIKSYVIKEALLSSAIEGIHTTLLDIYTQPLLSSPPNKDTQLVMNYTKALDGALNMIQKEDFPIVSRVLLQAHKTLMETGDGDKADPGNYRKQSVRVGNLIPAPPQEIPNLMHELEIYINTNTNLPALINAGLAHVQFETIHPFLDGNGRIGRLLIVLMLINNKLLAQPIIYPSYYFKKHHLEYYQLLDRVRTDGDFEGWISFYLKAIRDSSIDAYQRTNDIEILRRNLSNDIIEHKQFSKMHDTLLQALNILFNYPIINVTELSKQLDMTYNTANQVLKHFVHLGFVTEETKQKRGKIFKFEPYWKILERD